MRTRLLIAAAALVVAGCGQTTSGTVAMTTESGSSGGGSTYESPTSTTRTTSPRTTTSDTSTPGTSTTRSSSNVPPPADSMTMTCKQYLDLDADTQDAVISAILAQSEGFFDPSQQDVAKILADSSCTFLPDAVVSDLLTGTPP